MKVVDVNIDNHYPLFQMWWDGHNVPHTPKPILSVPGYAIRTDRGQYLAALWVYAARDIKLFWLAWMVTNPSAPMRDTYKGLATLIDHAQEKMKEEGYFAGITNSPSDGLTHLLEKHGWEINHDVTQLVTLL